MQNANIPEHCTPTTTLLSSISDAFNTCVPTPLALLSTLLGIFSIISWLFAQLPQIFKNYTLQSTSGLSIHFLAIWLLGDATNLLGALLTRQAAWQVVVAAYYVTVDVALVWQFCWYSYIRPRYEGRMRDSSTGNGGTHHGRAGDVIVGVSAPDRVNTPAGDREQEGDGLLDAKPRNAKLNPFRLANFSFSPKEKATPSSSYRSISRPSDPFGAAGPSPKTILLISMLYVVLTNASPLNPQPTNNTSPTTSSTNNTETAGRILSWISTLSYLSSRLPQLYKNFLRRSTAGLSPALFIAAFLGNLFYSTSLLTNPLAWSSSPPYGLHGWAGPDGSDRDTWVSLAAPFWLGAAGVLALDGAVGVQFLVYGEEKKVVRVDDGRGRGRWRRVSGWMRGWVPSPSPARVKPQEDERPLLARSLASEDCYGAA